MDCDLVSASVSLAFSFCFRYFCSRSSSCVEVAFEGVSVLWTNAIPSVAVLVYYVSGVAEVSF
jgi:hypothetical protein